MTLLFCSLVALCVTTILGILDRNERRYYYVATGIFLAGAFLSFFGYQNKAVSPDNYTAIRTQILAFERYTATEAVRVTTIEREFYLSPSYLSEEERETILNLEWTSKEATLWVGSHDGSDVKGLVAEGLEIDRFRSAGIDREFYRTLINVGVIISGFGLLLFILHYFTSGRQPR